MCMCMFLFFFFKQKTAYEMRISDWSSDVCSSDLILGHGIVQRLDQHRGRRVAENEMAIAVAPVQMAASHLRIDHQHRACAAEPHRVDRSLDTESGRGAGHVHVDRKSPRLNSSH